MQNSNSSGSDTIGLLIIGAILVVVLYVYQPGIFSHISVNTSVFKSTSSANTTTTDTTQMINTTFGAYAQQAMRIANCESGMNADAVNSQSVDGSYATGLFQILVPSTWNTTSYANGDPKDPNTNTLAAFEIFKRDGYSWRQWACARIVGLS